MRTRQSGPGFGKIFLAALTAFVAGSGVMLLSLFYFLSLLGAIIGSSTSSGTTTVAPGSVLQIDLSETISDKPEPATLFSIDLRNMRINTPSSLLGVLRAVEAAKNDKDIKGIYLCGAADPGFDPAQGEELRAALKDFKESGKFIVAWSEYYSQLGYYVCSVADRVAISPMGDFTWHGVSANMLFFKGLLDKLDVKAEVIRHGTFKSAVEPFVLDRMSPENALQMNALVGSVWGTMVGDAARDRGLDSATLQKMASGLAIRTAQDAFDAGLVNAVVYRDQALAYMGMKVSGAKEAEKAGEEWWSDSTTYDAPDMITLNNYANRPQGGARFERPDNEIAVLYADGEIVDGRGDRGQVGAVTFAGKVADLRKDKKIKGVVLRINSPGGSALAAENIWRELSLLQKEKPLVVSIGETAASGGYYIAAPADVIVTDRTSVTGSIGVFGLMFDVEKGLKSKLGITTDVARSNPSADLDMPLRPLTTAEIEYLQVQVDQVYKTFVEHVARGRNMTFEAVDRISQGRVWSGADAEAIGLCDGVGGLKHAIALAADRAGIADDYSIYEVAPAPNSFVEAISSMLGGTDARAPRTGVAAVLEQYADALSMLGRKGVQARMPYILKIR